MLKIKRITNKKDSDWESLLRVYVSSFPYRERREEDTLKDMISADKTLHINSVKYGKENVGLLVYWDFNEFSYIEHFAIEEDFRNRGLGFKVISWIKNRQSPAILEVEPPEDEISGRRIAFYERNGFSVISKYYLQPPYRKEESPFPLWLMGTPGIKKDAGEIISTLYNRVYNMDFRPSSKGHFYPNPEDKAWA